MDKSLLERRERELAEAIKLAFKLLDTEKKNGVTPEMIADIDGEHPNPRYPENEIEDYSNEFKKFDSDGLVEFDEFFDLVTKTIQNETLLKEGINDAFSFFDQRKKELIDANDFRTAMESLGEKITDDELKDMMNKAALRNENEIGKDDFIDIVGFNQFVKTNKTENDKSPKKS